MGATVRRPPGEEPRGGARRLEPGRLRPAPVWRLAPRARAGLERRRPGREPLARPGGTVRPRPDALRQGCAAGGRGGCWVHGPLAPGCRSFPGSHRGAPALPRHRRVRRGGGHRHDHRSGRGRRASSRRGDRAGTAAHGRCAARAHQRHPSSHARRHSGRFRALRPLDPRRDHPGLPLCRSKPHRPCGAGGARAIGRRPLVVLTGGEAPALRGLLQSPCVAVPDLVLRGLAILAAEPKPGRRR